jgi:cysteine desulfurase
LFEEIPARIKGCRINGTLQSRLPNNVHVSFEGIHSQSLLAALDMLGVRASMGAACDSGSMDVSRVLRAIGLNDALARGALRLTSGRWIDDAQVDSLLEILPGAVERARC